METTSVFDCDLLVIGAGSGGLAAAIRAASYGARVAIVEKASPGGACVNYGCIPEKLLDYAASFNRLEQVAASYGWQNCERRFSWSQFVQAKEQYLQHLNQIHGQHLQEVGVKFLQGEARFLDAHTLLVADRPITANKILIAVGAKPSKPNIPGIEHTITWHELYQRPEQPKHITVIGGDSIGVKIVGSMAVLGTEVTQILATDRILPGIDTEIATVIQERLTQQGVQILANADVRCLEQVGDRIQLTLTSNDLNPLLTDTVCSDTVLIDAPRVPNLAALHLETLGIQLTASGAIRVDEFSRTTHTNIFAIGDCTERIPLTPSAIAQGRAFADTEFGDKPHTAHLEWVPISISSQPEAATVGFSEDQARKKFGDAVFCYHTQFRPLLYSLSQLPEKTFLKVVVNRQDSERILGIHLVGEGAVEIIQSLAVALKLGATKHDLDTAIGIHPSTAEELFSL